MDKEIIEYHIPIQDKKHIDEWNEKFSKVFDDFEPYKSTEEHIDILMNKFYDAIQKVGDDGGWYTCDGINVKIELEYEPESK